MEGAADFRAGALKSHLSHRVFLQLWHLKGFSLSEGFGLPEASACPSDVRILS